ncbi:MAG: iron ABC transporter permease [Desulfamplus sp.]|nr:iron ABC transporter permease [Desulfamplus sp.]
MDKRDKYLIPLIVGFIPFIFLLLFYFYPLAGIFIRSFFDQNDFTFQSIFSFKFLKQAVFFTNFLKIFESSRILSIIWFTFWQASVSTILTLIVALPCSYVMGTFEFKGKKLIMTLATLPFVLPTIVVATSFQIIPSLIQDTILLLLNSQVINLLLGEHIKNSLFDNQFLNFLKNENPIIMIFFAHVFYNFSVVLRITSSFWSSLSKDMKEAASILGANNFQTFFKVTLPLLRPAIFASAMLVFIFCFSSFGVVLILGGPSFSTIEVEIYRQAAHLFNLPVASILSLFQIFFTFAMMLVYTRLQKKIAMFTPESERFSLKKPYSAIEKLLVSLSVLFIILLCGLPMVALLLKSIYYKGSLSLIFYRELFLNSSGSIFYVSPIVAILNSLMFAFITLIMALIVGSCAAILIKQCSYTDQNLGINRNLSINRNPRINRNLTIKKYISSIQILFGKLLEPLFMLPLSTSAVTLGFGMIITLDKPPLNLRTSIFLIPIIHTLVAFPFVVRAVLPALKSIPLSLKEAASLMGASPFRVWLHIELPIIARALSIGAVFAFTVSLGEFGAALFAARPEFTTMPITIYKLLGQPGIMNYGQAMAMSSILMLVTSIGFIFIENIRQFGHEGF